MNRNRFVHFAATGLFIAGLPLFAAHEALPKAETILDRYVEVTGGKKAYTKHKTEMATLSVEILGKGIKGTGTHYADGDNTLETINIEGVGTIQAGTYNGVVWESNQIMGPRVLDGDEKADHLRDARFNAPIHWREIWKGAQTAGTENVEGEDCYKVVLTPADGKPETTYFSKKSGLVIKRTRTVLTPMGEIPAEILAQEYKSFDGLLLPTRIIQKAVGAEMAITTEDVKFNVPVPADKLEPPAEVKKLLAK